MNGFFIVNDVLNVDKYLPDLPKDDTLVVHIDIWEVKTKYKKLAWSKFRNIFINCEEKNIVIVGMNRIRTSQSRYDMVYSHIYKLNSYESKFVIDEHPFTGEPWRLWYIYGFLFHTWIMGENSMPLQGQWKNWFERKIDDCPISGSNVLKHVKNTFSDKDPLLTTFGLRPPELSENNKYIEVKKTAFEKYDTPRQIISFMVKNLDLNINYDSYLTNDKIILPDFGISRFMIEENNRRMDIYNNIINNGRENFKG